MIKNITLSADDELIKTARKKANKNNITLNDLFRHWLASYVRDKGLSNELDDFLKKTDYVVAGRHFTREELNER